ncbi:hypothetical protein AMTRI_Chr04g188960 [Amborella trichopoda]
MGDPLSPPLVDCDYINGIDAAQGQIKDAMKVMGFPQTGPEGPFLEFFKANLQSRVWVSKNGTCELANLACSINYNTPSSSNLSLFSILLKDHPKGLSVRRSLRNSLLLPSPPNADTLMEYPRAWNATQKASSQGPMF